MKNANLNFGEGYFNGFADTTAGRGQFRILADLEALVNVLPDSQIRSSKKTPQERSFPPWWPFINNVRTRGRGGVCLIYSLFMCQDEDEIKSFRSF